MSTESRTAWRSYRIRLWLTVGCAVAALLGWLPPLRRLGVGIWLVGGMVLMLLWMLAFPCPVCGRPFFRKSGWQNLLARRCLHCGLPKYQVQPPAGR